MALVDKKMNWVVKTKLEQADGKTVINFVPIPPEGVEYSSPSEGIFITVRTPECVVNVGDIVEGILVAQADDGQTEEQTEQ